MKEKPAFFGLVGLLLYLAISQSSWKGSWRAEGTDWFESVSGWFVVKGDTLFIGNSPSQVVDFSNINYLVFPPGDVVFNVIRPETFLTGTKLGKSGYNYDSAYVLHISSDSGYVKMPKVKTNYVVWDLVQTSGVYGFYITAGGSYGRCYGSLHGATSDSIVIDSIHVIVWKNDANVYIDSLRIFSGLTRTCTNEHGDLLWTDGTDRATGTSGQYHFDLYPNISISTDWRIEFQAYPGGTSGAVYFYSIKCYGHYK